MGLYLHRELDYEFLQALSNLTLLRSLKWSLNLHETGSFMYNCCVFSLMCFPKLRSLKIVYIKCFLLEAELLELLISSELKKFHVNADKIRVDKVYESCSLRTSNVKLRQLKIRVNNFNANSHQIYEIKRLMKIMLRTFDKLRVLHLAPVKDTVMEDVIQYQVSEILCKVGSCRNCFLM